MDAPTDETLESSIAGQEDLAWLDGFARGSNFYGSFGLDYDENREVIDAFVASGREHLSAMLYPGSRRERDAFRRAVRGVFIESGPVPLSEPRMAADALEFLSWVPDLKRLTLWFTLLHGQKAMHFDMNRLYNLKKLESLGVTWFDGDIDWLRLLHLKELHWSQFYLRSACELESLLGLERLAVTGYVPKGKGLADLSVLPMVRTLGFRKSSVQALTGLSRWPRLERLVFSELPRIKSIAPLADCPGLKHLTIHRSRQLADHQLAVYLPNLESLCLAGCGMMESLGFLDDMPNLKHFDFCGTGVMDGDLRPLFRLKSARFWPRRNFSHTPKQIEEINREVHEVG